MQILIAFVAIFVFVEASTPPPGVPCVSDQDCPNPLLECCYKKHDDLLVSKRQATFEGYPYPYHHRTDYSNVTGVCQRHKLEGDSCSTFDKTNGYCSCNQKMGMTCKYVTDPASIIVKRKVFVPGGRGAFRCAKELLVS